MGCRARVRNSASGGTGLPGGIHFASEASVSWSKGGASGSIRAVDVVGRGVGAEVVLRIL
jgi:hypothetical protein